MTFPGEETVLLGALLDRLGKTQAHALLVRLDQWLTRDDRESPQVFDRDQRRDIDTPYDRRRGFRSVFHK